MRYRAFLASLVAAIAMSGQTQATEAATELLIRVPAPAGYTGPVRLEKAQLLLAWWGHTEEVPLAHRYEAGELVVTVPLDREAWASLEVPHAPDFAYVYLEFADFVPVRSERFSWLGGNDPEAGRPSVVQFRFRGGRRVDIRNGERREVSLQVRRPVSKQVRFLDDRGRPFTGITVDGGVFWSRDNHCGYPSGLKPLFANRRPNAAGVLPVPDGDFEYGVRINGARHATVIGAPDHDPSFLAAFIDTPELLVRIRRHQLVPLTVRVSVGGKPAAGVLVRASVRGACMNGTGPLGRTDDRGVLHVPDFYPEEFDAVCVGGVADEPFWSRVGPIRREITVDLPAGTNAGDVQYCYGTER